MLGPQAINLGIAGNKAKSSSHAKDGQQIREQVRNDLDVRVING